MNPLFTLGEEFRFHDSSRFRKKAGDAKFRFYHSFVPVLMSLTAESCRSRTESVRLLQPYLQWGKGWKSSNFVTPDDSASNRKMRKMMSRNSSICLIRCPFLGLERYIEFGLPKAVLPSSAPGCLCHPSCLLWFHSFWRTFEAAGCVPSVMSQPQKQDCHTLERVDLARPFLVSPAIKIEIKNSLEMALSKAKSGSAWQSHFWKCGTLPPARNTKLFTLRK